MSDKEPGSDRRSDEWNAYDSNEWNVWSLGPAAYPSKPDGADTIDEAAESLDAHAPAGGAAGAAGSLATERDIDPGFGMFEDGLAGSRMASAEDRLLAMYPDNELPAAGEAEAGEFPDVPDADAIAADSPVDPASPPDQFHGTDLLNGVGLRPEEEADVWRRE